MNGKKKILYIWKGHYPWDVRVEKFCKSLVKANFEVFLLSRWNNEQLQNEIIDEINIIRVGYKKNSKFSLPIPFNPLWKQSIKEAVEQIKPNLIIAREIMLAEPSAKMAKKNNIPVIMDMAENYPAAMKDWKKYNKSFISKTLVHLLDIPEKIEKRAVSLMDGIITVCDEQNNRLVNQYNYAFNKLQVVHNTPEKNIKRSNNTNLSNVLVFGHHGYTSAEKSLLNFVKAFIIASDTDNNIRLKISGIGESIDDLKELVKSSNKMDYIEFSGSYKYSEMNSIIESYDLGVIPYQISDFNNYTIHNKIFDFFAFGKPVLVSETIPFKRIIKETDAGILCNCDNIDEITKCILSVRNYELDKFAKNGLKAFENKYNWDIDSANLIKFIEGFI